MEILFSESMVHLSFRILKERMAYGPIFATGYYEIASDIILMFCVLVRYVKGSGSILLKKPTVSVLVIKAIP